MREIGKTNKNERIIALTTAESSVLLHLQDALDGLPQDWFRRVDEFQALKEEDFAPVFRAIWLWTKAKFKVNDLQNAIDELNESLGYGNEAENVSKHCTKEIVAEEVR